MRGRFSRSSEWADDDAEKDDSSELVGSCANSSLEGTVGSITGAPDRAESMTGASGITVATD